MNVKVEARLRSRNDPSQTFVGAGFFPTRAVGIAEMQRMFGDRLVEILPEDTGPEALADPHCQEH